VKRAAAMAALGALVMLAACSSSAKHASAPTTGPSTAVTTVPAACTPARSAPPARVSYTFQHRAYRLAVPRNYDGAHAYPMVLLFHGFASSKEAIDADTSLDRLGSARGDIVVTPDGSGNPRTWNLFDPNATDDFGFVDKLVAHLDRELCVDTARIYATGHSAGSAFAGFLVCKQPYRFAAVAMVSATVPSACPANMKESVLGIHGTADPAVLYDGGKGAGQSVAIPPIKETIADYAKRASCRTNSTDRQTAGVERLRYRACAPGKQVELLTIVGGGHPWPGGLQATHERNAVPGARFEASAAILDFFDRVAST
jgi:polyhydroxybutyrate depolymerase